MPLLLYARGYDFSWGNEKLRCHQKNKKEKGNKQRSRKWDMDQMFPLA